jgi:Cu2+-exporting ATPase
VVAEAERRQGTAPGLPEEQSGNAGALKEAEEFRALPGNGLEARFGGRLMHAGSGKFIRTLTKVGEELSRAEEELANQGKTPLFFEEDGELLGIIAVADVIKEDSPEAVRQLKNMGIDVVMLTGDNERTARAIGAQAGVTDVIAGVLPEGKEAEIRKLQQRGKVAMVGDGINDAPALTRADIGIAIGAGADVAVDAADVVLMKNRLTDVPAAIRLSRATLRNIRQNLFWAFIYNSIGIPLAAGCFIRLFGWTLNPMFGAAAMSLSSFSVVSNALRLNWFRLYDAGRDRKAEEADISDVLARFRVKDSESASPPGTELRLEIEGMMCEHCEARVRKALEAVPGVESAAADHKAGTAVVTLSMPVADDMLKAAVEAQDYQVTGLG